MYIQLVNSDAIGKAEAHTLEVMLDQLGYFYQWQPPDTLDANVLTLSYHQQFKELARSMVYIPRHSPLSQLRKTQKWQKCTYEGQTLPVMGFTTIKPPEETAAYCFDFDMVANVYYHLFRIEEADFNHPDDVDEKVTESILYHYGQFRRPVVDYLLRWLQQALEQTAEGHQRFLLRKARYPGGQPFGATLTHDVDFIRAYHPLKKAFKKGKARLRGDARKLQTIDQRDNDYWAFDRLLPFYADQHITATFFFLARYTEGLHLRYRLQSKRMRRLLEKLNCHDHEIALHPSRYAFEHPRRYMREKNRLQQSAGTMIHGMRHHYLRGIFPGLWHTAQALQLNYDATLVYRRYSGFRAGAGFPYRTFDAAQQKSLAVYECPTLFFENTLPQSGHDAQAALQVIDGLLTTVKSTGGLFNILWHTASLYQPQPLAQIWQAIMDRLLREEAFLAPLSRQVQWARQRRDIRIQTLSRDNARWHITLQCPPQLQNFTLQCRRPGLSVASATEQVYTEETARGTHIRCKGSLPQIQLTVVDHG
ncbi:MAG: hypothetical protein GF313_11430 [Caldithrix sp.]|nr:hypothetical protein [Caldithrix sp.]